KERQREGIAKAKAEKRYKGRKPTARGSAARPAAPRVRRSARRPRGRRSSPARDPAPETGCARRRTAAAHRAR
ncbi:hypothetical protein ACIKTA_17620, partial [Hansschlegelia beijingensis]